MPVNYAQVDQGLREFSRKVKSRQDEIGAYETELWERFSNPDLDLQAARQHVEKAEAVLKNLYCAKPVLEPFNFVSRLPEKPERYTLVAADGSQIAPNRHRSFQYCVINVGLIRACMGSGQEPEIEVQSSLLDYDAMYSPEGVMIGEQGVALERDLAERQALLDFAVGDSRPVIALTDGPLDVYQRLDSERDMRDLQVKVLALHKAMEARGILSCGYIDKPGSEMISRLFSLLEVPEAELIRYDAKKVRHGVSDASLLRRLLTHSGDRSAIFETVTQNRSQKGERLKVHFFYLNVGGDAEEERWLVRVEFPEWISAEPALVDLVHAVVYADSQVLDARPYPYILQRAHELAVINMAEYEEVEALIARHFEEADLMAGESSHKQDNKDLLKEGKRYGKGRR